MSEISTRTESAILHSIPLPAIIMTADLRIVDVNMAFAKAVARERQPLIGQQLFDQFPPRPKGPSLEDEVRASVKRAIASGATDVLRPGRHDIIVPDIGYEARYWRLSHTPIVSDEKTHRILQLVEDVTSEVAKDKLQASRERLAAEAAALSFWDLNLTTGELVRSDTVDRLYGFEPGEAGDNVAAFLERVHPEDQKRIRKAAVSALGKRKYPAILEHRVLLSNGQIRWLSARGEPRTGQMNDAPHLAGIIIDVTDFYEQEARLRQALANQKLLLDEMNHRVKNSLQMVSSMLNLEGAQATEEARARLHSVSARVTAIAAVHANLYQDGNVTSIAADAFLGELCNHLAMSNRCEEKNVQVEVDIDPIRLCTDIAIGVSIIVNELVGNALQHAFQRNQGGTIKVRLSNDAHTGISLCVQENGKRAESELNATAKRTSNLSERLVEMSVRKLAGRLEHTQNEYGAKTTVFLQTKDV